MIIFIFENTPKLYMYNFILFLIKKKNISGKHAILDIIDNLLIFLFKLK
jgi:hypothetical protein